MTLSGNEHFIAVQSSSTPQKRARSPVRGWVNSIGSQSPSLCVVARRSVHALQNEREGCSVSVWHPKQKRSMIIAFITKSH